MCESITLKLLKPIARSSQGRPFCYTVYAIPATFAYVHHAMHVPSKTLLRGLTSRNTVVSIRSNRTECSSTRQISELWDSQAHLHTGLYIICFHIFCELNCAFSTVPPLLLLVPRLPLQRFQRPHAGWCSTRKAVIVVTVHISKILIYRFDIDRSYRIVHINIEYNFNISIFFLIYRFKIGKSRRNESMKTGYLFHSVQ